VRLRHRNLIERERDQVIVDGNSVVRSREGIRVEAPFTTVRFSSSGTTAWKERGWYRRKHVRVVLFYHNRFINNTAQARSPAAASGMPDT